jgi:hypothetical protein
MATPRNREIRLKQRPVGLPTALIAEVGRHAPNGMAIYFENAGGAHREAALEPMNPSGIIVYAWALASEVQDGVLWPQH